MIKIQRVVRIRCILYTVCLLWCSEIPLPRFRFFQVQCICPCNSSALLHLWNYHPDQERAPDHVVFVFNSTGEGLE